jgi:ABC transporter with metal-binding/Fe-S-binding domain ATP-binding protein
MEKWSKVIQLKVAVLFSGGKDSTYTLWIALHQYSVKAILTVLSSEESYLYHYQKEDIANALAEAIDIPMLIVKAKNEREEFNNICNTLRELKVEALLIGGLLSEFQRNKFNEIAKQVEIPCFAPLWRKDHKLLLQDLKNYFHVIFTTVASMGFNESDIGKKLDDNMFKRLNQLNRNYGVSIGGEGGEYETLVLDAPFYKKKIVIENAEVIWDETKSFGYYKINKLKLVNKR